MSQILTEIFNNAEHEVRILSDSLCNEAENNSTYIEALSDFIEKGGMLYIVLTDFSPEKAHRSNLFKRLAYYISSDRHNIDIRSTSIRPVISSKGKQIPVRITLGDSCAYRIETDIENRTALCNMSDQETTLKLMEMFDVILNNEDCKAIDLAELFNLKSCVDYGA